MKTIKTKYILLALLLFASIFNACDDYLEMETEGKISQEEFYQDDNSVKSSTLAAYDVLQALYAEDWHSLWFVKTLLSDEINCGGGNSSDQPDYQALSSLSHTPTNGVLNPVYKWLYSGIYNCNIVLDNVPNETDAQKTARAEAKCLRAYYYFELVTLFGNVPLVTTVLEDGANPDFSAPATIWTQIETDLTEAIPDLPRKGALTGVNAFRVSQGTALALLGKSLLFQEKYADAAAKLQTVIDSADYSLAGDFSQVLKIPTEFGSESLFEIEYITTEGHTWGNGTFPWGNGRKQENNIHWQLCGPRGDGYFEAGNSGLVNGWGFGYPREEMYEAFTDAGDLVRRSSSIMSEDELIALGGDYRLDGELPYDCDGYVRLKYGTWADETNTATQAELNYGTNVRIIRYADVLLMAAEAYVGAGTNLGLAREYLDEVRDRVDLAPYSGSDLLEGIKSERQRELMFEGHRFVDLVRWGDASTALAYKGYEAKHALLPIPADELAVTGKTQPNPGW
jgi:starch-binding outer membrane protein, SusD/RagB family